MGEAAEDMLDGTCCQGCGEWMDDILAGEDAPGYPRWCERCQPDEAPSRRQRLHPRAWRKRQKAAKAAQA